MPGFVKWDSQPLDEWARKYARGDFIDLNGKSTHYIEKGEGEPVILLHGFFFDSTLWTRNMDALAEKFKVYVPDFWGFGFSTREPLDYGYPLFARQVLEFMDELGIERASLVGQSMGGGTSILFCVEHRERIDKLLLVDPAGIPNPLPLTGKFLNLPGVGELIMGLSTNMVRMKNLCDFWVCNPETITDSLFDEVTRFQKVKGTTGVLLSILRKQFFDKLSDDIHRLARMDSPVMLVWGREDRAVPLQCGEQMHEILKGSRMEIVDEAGHVPNLERPQEFNRLAVEFLLE